MGARHWKLGVALALLGTGLACEKTLAQTGGRAPGTRAKGELKVAEPIYAQGLRGDWQDYGWAPRKPHPPGAELIDLADKGGWILAKPGLKGNFGGVKLRFRAPAELGDFLEVRVDSTRADVFPRIQTGPAHRVDLPDGWSEIFVPMEELNPNAVGFDRVVIRAHRKVPSLFVELDEVGLTAFDPSRPHPLSAAKPITGPVREVTANIDCRAPPRPISPLIYGIAYTPRTDEHDGQQWQLGATARRWGGNPSSRYNWELGNAWNTGSDYYFRNLNYTGKPDYTYDKFLEDDRDFKVQSALTVPLLGWVAKDIKSYSFPLSEFGAQQDTDPDLEGPGNGVSKDGKPLTPGPPTRTSVAATPEFVGRWVKAIRAKDAKRGRTVQMYILDNEPMLWHDTHRDVHPEPASYDELLTKTVAYATEVRKADPEAVIAGPAEWGWPNYFSSAVDSKISLTLRPDRRKHGDVPLVAWYLRKLREHEQKTKVKLLDVLDLHFYPQGKGIGTGEAGKVDAQTAALRIRSTRALWDPTYQDESWIDEKVMLIPRMRQWVAENYPGLGLSLGEYNFGAENHISGGLALAEALGRFGQQGLTSAFYWTYPPKDSPAFYAFRAYRNYDGKGAHFLDISVPTRPTDALSVFASRDEAGKKVVAVVLNLDPNRTVQANLNLEGCAPVEAKRVFQYQGDPAGFTELKPSKTGKVEEVLPPYSITVVELTLGTRKP